MSPAEGFPGVARARPATSAAVGPGPTDAAAGELVLGRRAGGDHEEASMPRYQMVYGDDEQVVRETYDDVDVVREDGWTVLFRGNDAIVRVRDEHVKSLEQVD